MAQVKSNNDTKSSKGSKGSSGGSKQSVKTHTVKRGETLSSIARKYGCTVKEIKKWNNMKSDKVQAGQKLKIKK
jgi:membrane-bound lytic murein transglycosylase D